MRNIRNTNGSGPSTHGRAGVGHQRTAHGRPLDKALLSRLDDLDERIWAAAHTADDAQLAVRTARDFADDVFLGIVVGAGDGRHRVNCSVSVASDTLAAPAAMPLMVMADALAIALPPDRSDHEICELIALAHVTAAPAVVVLRSSALDGPAPELADDFTVRGWRIANRRCEPLDAAGIFAVSCSEAIEPLPIHPGTHYEDAYPLVRLPRSDELDEPDDDGNLVTV
jgi:hypothetical protein